VARVIVLPGSCISNLYIYNLELFYLGAHVSLN